MPRLIIKNIGPIKEADLELNKVNVFIGPQSSGKSTIAKMVSFCSWLEKASMRDDTAFSENHEAFRRLQSYHHMEAFFSPDSTFFYAGENVSYGYNLNGRTAKIPWEYESVEHLSHKEVFFYPASKAVSPKVIYIPAERNFVSVVPNLHKYAEANDNLMDFVQSWLEARRKYSEDHKLQILNLGVNYFSREGISDVLEIEGGKPLAMSAASSGLQSIVPLLTLIDWLAYGIYKEDKPFSFSEREKINHLLTEMDKDLSAEEIASLRQRLAGFIKGKIYTHTQFIIEEPEQNLFPTTQCELMYHLLRTINHGRKHRLVVTTHSPYILYALNNSMLFGQLKDVLPQDVKDSLACRDAWITPDMVGVWQIEDGKLINIKEETTQTIGKHYFNDVMNGVLDDYYRMMPYFKFSMQ